MALKISSWIIGVGCLMAAAGLCFLPAAFGEHRDMAVFTAGAMVFSAGMVLAAVGLYVKARFLAEGGPPKPSLVRRENARFCNHCGENESAVECRVHHLNLCPDCLGKHYDFKSCAYVPSMRPIQTKSKAAGA